MESSAHSRQAGPQGRGDPEKLAEREDRECCLAVDMDDYVGEPVRPLEHLDPSYIGGLRGLPDGERIVGVVVDRFLRSAPARFVALRQALAADDLATLERLAHGLMGVAGNLGARRMWALCARVETLARVRATEALGATLVSLEDEFGRVQALLPGQH